MWHHLGKVPGERCSGCLLLRNTRAERVGVLPGAALKLTASSRRSARCSHIHTGACVLLPSLPTVCGCRTISHPTPPRGVTHSKWRCSCILSKAVPLSKGFITCLHTSAWNYWGKKLLCPDNLLLLCRSFCSFVCLFAALVCRGFLFLFLHLLIDLCCHGLELQLNMETNSDCTWRLERRCWPGRAAHQLHHLPQSAQAAQTPLTVPSRKATSHQINTPHTYFHWSCLPPSACPAASLLLLLSACAWGPQSNQVQGCTAAPCGAEPGDSWR